MSEETTFKLIVALKFISELPKDLSSSIVVAEITKNAVLPLHEVHHSLHIKGIIL
jgi:hypothetical protein